MRRIAFFCASLVAASLGATETAADTFRSELHDFGVEVLSSELDSPWGLTFLPDGSMLITEQDGQLRRFWDGRLSPPLEGVPAVATGGQRGLLDVEIDPQFAGNRRVYLTLTETGGGGTGVSVVRATFTGSALEGAQAIFRQNSKRSSPFHFGSRIAFAPDGTLFFTIGDRWDPASAQDPMDHSGSVLRIGRDGSVPPDNPSSRPFPLIRRVGSAVQAAPASVLRQAGSGAGLAGRACVR